MYYDLFYRKLISSLVAHVRTHDYTVTVLHFWSTLTWVIDVPKAFTKSYKINEVNLKSFHVLL